MIFRFSHYWIVVGNARRLSALIEYCARTIKDLIISVITSTWFGWPENVKWIGETHGLRVAIHIYSSPLLSSAHVYTFDYTYTKLINTLLRLQIFDYPFVVHEGRFRTVTFGMTHFASMISIDFVQIFYADIYTSTKLKCRDIFSCRFQIWLAKSIVTFKNNVVQIDTQYDYVM